MRSPLVIRADWHTVYGPRYLVQDGDTLLAIRDTQAQAIAFVGEQGRGGDVILVPGTPQTVLRRKQALTVR